MSAPRDDKGRFLPGQSGNPAGRPVGSVSLAGRLKALIAEDPAYADRLLKRIMKDAVHSDEPSKTIAARALVFNRVDGPLSAFDAHDEGDGSGSTGLVINIHPRIEPSSEGSGD